MRKNDRNNRFLTERLNVTNDLLLSILILLETETTTERNNATEEPIEADFLKGTSKSHNRDMISSKLVETKKRKKKKNRKNPKNQEKSKTVNKSNLEKKQNQEENLENKQQDQ